ncbi:NAD(P)H-binding protein [Actinosynnema sp. NPDC047251]|uniref:NmrA family protein n=1 Tax=Saccharothrix espanaensis (strain ATCC 51144 / DSM 44229 / JCM 9112 / NBRC 15066 / NRRL 15764) TaxID=1179773 RepID=K0JQP7_SACES|nr:NAD(P)H-binding protein [Saccharothrix espanaensis]CCH29770.1 NmrA family protein [Saccharothrix espanaensis DSM 44229]
MFLITGATGTTGGLVRSLLLERGADVRGMTRDPTRPDDVHGDYDDPGSLVAALTGVEAAYLVPASQTAEHDVNFVAAAREAGVRRIVRLSAIGTGEEWEGEVIAPWHLAGEEAVRDSGLEWTVLRPSSFATNLTREPVHNLTGDVPQAVIDPRDVAAVAVEALTTSAHHGRLYTLTGPAALSVPEQVAILGAARGRPVEVVDVDPAAFDPAWRNGVLWSRSGRNAVVTDDVSRVLGRPAGSFERWAREVGATA